MTKPALWNQARNFGPVDANMMPKLAGLWLAVGLSLRSPSLEIAIKLADDQA
jgi:hypothetical protein